MSKKSGLKRRRATEAARMSKLRFAIPPIGRTAPVSSGIKNGELAERVADFIEVTPFTLAIVGPVGRGLI
ncbi:hypothetical protein EME01_15370 [Sinorhizobium meliloti]|nr:hypothetical protein EME01_15370 [Sinorhizobium meliloti]